jgi:hypothetical protein
VAVALAPPFSQKIRHFCSGTPPAMAALMTTVIRNLAAVLLALVSQASCSNEDSCRKDLAQIGCAATLAQQARIGACPGCCGLAGPCGTYRVWQSEPNYFSLTCIYDSSGEHLLSAKSCGDTPICEGTQFCESAGQSVDLTSSCDQKDLPRICSATDGGAGD